MPRKEGFKASIPQELFDMPLEQLDLSVRAMNLRRGGITLWRTGQYRPEGTTGMQSRSRAVQERLKALGLSFAAAWMVVKRKKVAAPRKSKKKESRIGNKQEGQKMGIKYQEESLTGIVAQDAMSAIW